MAPTATITVQPVSELVDLVKRFEASNVESLERAVELADAVAPLEPFLLGDLDPVVVPRSYLERLVERRERLAAALEPFTVDDEEATS